MNENLFRKPHQNFCFGFPLLSLVDLFLCTFIAGSEQFSGSQAGYRTTFRDTGGFQKAGTSSLKRVMHWKEFHN
jgi:hypothetical protein